MDENKNNSEIDEQFPEEDGSTYSDEDVGDVSYEEGLLSREIDIDRGSFTVSLGTVSINDIVIPVPIKESRKETYLGLSRSVEELGVLVPVHVMVTESYSEYVEENGSDDGYDGPKYILLDGLRRIFALKKNNLDRVNAVIYDFLDKDKGSDMVNILSMVLNRVQGKSWQEKWYLYQVLESQSELSPGNIEYLLQLEPGDAMKLKEVMVRKSDFPEPADDLLSKKKSLQQAYNALVKAMKDQDMLAVEDVSGVSNMEQTEGVVSEGKSDRKLSDDEVREILDMADKFDDELSDNDFDEFMGNNAPERQEVGNRHPLDPALKASTLMRDNYMCQCCGAGEGYPMKYALSFLQSHHKVSVANSGTDEERNIITVCENCHTLIHVLLKNNMKFGISKKDYDALPEFIRVSMLNVMKIARIDWEAGKRLGKNKEDFRKDNMNTMKFNMPGTDLAKNTEALQMKGIVVE